MPCLPRAPQIDKVYLLCQAQTSSHLKCQHFTLLETQQTNSVIIDQIIPSPQRKAHPTTLQDFPIIHTITTEPRLNASTQTTTGPLNNFNPSIINKDQTIQITRQTETTDLHTLIVTEDHSKITTKTDQGQTNPVINQLHQTKPQ